MPRLTYEEYRYLWGLVSKTPFLTGFPLHLDVEISSRCNLTCDFCFQHHMTNKKGNMSFELFKKIVDEGVEEGLCGLKLQSRGEALMNSKFLEFLSYAKERRIMDVHVTTNGLLLTDEKLREAVNSGLDLLIFSYDVHHADSTKMTLDEYTKFIQDRVRKANSERVRQNRNMKLRVQTSIEDFSPDKITETEKVNRALFPEADVILINRIYDSHEDADHFKGRLQDFELYPCSYLWQRLTIYDDGEVTTCSKDYNSKYNRLGSVVSQSVKSIWHSEEMQKLRKGHLANRRCDFHICALCELYSVEKKTSRLGTPLDVYEPARWRNSEASVVL